MMPNVGGWRNPPLLFASPGFPVQAEGGVQACRGGPATGIDAANAGPAKAEKSMTTHGSSPTGVGSGFGGAANVSYLSRDELEPCDDPELECRRAVATLSKSSSKWRSKFDAINVLRRVAVLHARVFCSDAVNTMQLLAQEVSNLRSALSKNALLCAQDVFCSCGGKTAVSNHLDVLLYPLVVKGVEKNFQGEEARVALRDLATRCMLDRVCKALV